MLARLVAAECLSAGELDGLLAAYGEALRNKTWALEELERRGLTGPGLGSERQQVVWEAMHGRAIAFYRAEGEWLATLRWRLTKLSVGEG